MGSPAAHFLENGHAVNRLCSKVDIPPPPAEIETPTTQVEVSPFEAVREEAPKPETPSAQVDVSPFEAEMAKARAAAQQHALAVQMQQAQSAQIRHSRLTMMQQQARAAQMQGIWKRNTIMQPSMHMQRAALVQMQQMQQVQQYMHQVDQSLAQMQQVQVHRGSLPQTYTVH